MKTTLKQILDQQKQDWAKQPAPEPAQPSPNADFHAQRQAAREAELLRKLKAKTI